MVAISDHPQSAPVNDTELAYLDLGQGEPIVFVHGSLGDYRSWTFQTEAFRERRRVIAYSRRYHWPNESSTAGAIYSIEQHVVDLHALIEWLGVAPVHLAGSSYGAMTALTATVRRPDLVRSLVLGEPPLLPWLMALPDGPDLVEQFFTHAFRPAGRAFAAGEPATGIAHFLDGVFGTGAFDRMSPATLARMFENAPAMAAETSAPVERYFSPLNPGDLTQFAIPTLLLDGDRSPRMFGRITDELQRVLPHAERITIPAASHAMHTQNPTAYNEIVLDFLDRLPPPARG